MNTPMVSVIVPIYKAEKYIERCLDSVKAQTFSDFEVIMIDDGTPDRSAAIAEKYTADPRFRLYHQNNSGVGAVRNRAIALAQGEYLAFLDSDDAFTPEHLEKLCSAAKSADADIVCCGYCCCDEEGKHMRPSLVNHRQGVYCSHQLLGAVLRDISIRSYLWSKLWRKRLFTENRVFFPRRNFEDSCVIPVLFYHSETVAVIHDRTYIYTCRNNSITGLTSERCIGDYLTADEAVKAFYMNTPEAVFYVNHLRFRKAKAVCVTFCWLFVRVWRARTFEYFGANLEKIAEYAVRPVRPDEEPEEERAAGRHKLV